MYLNKKLKRGAWSFFSIVLIPTFLMVLYMVVAISGSTDIMKNRIQYALDNSIILVGKTGVKYTVSTNGEERTYCSFDESLLNEYFSIYIRKGIIEGIDGFNEKWEIKMEYNEGEYSWVTFDQLSETENGILTSYDEKMNEELEISLRAYIPRRTVSNYKKYYEEHQKDLKDYKNSNLWICIEVSSKVTCI